MFTVRVDWANHMPEDIFSEDIAQIADRNGQRNITLSEWLATIPKSKWKKSPLLEGTDEQDFSFELESDAKEFARVWQK